MKEQQKASSPLASASAAPALPQNPAPAPAPRVASEYDRRGIKLPARARVGGIITPQ